MILVLLLVIVLSMCIYKSFQQKQKRLSYMTYQNKTEKYNKVKQSLEKDRQVLLAIKFLESQPGYKDFGGNKNDKKLTDSNAYASQNSSGIIQKSSSEERASVIGLLKKTST